MTTPRFPLIDNMRNGGTFVRKLADAMAAADPVNYEILVNAFPLIVAKYSAQEQESYQRSQLDF